MIAIKDYKKKLPKEIIKRAEKMLVRELDEVKPSQYESYVDDAKETYDVKLAINKTGIVAKSTCDCEDGITTFCVHKTAVLISIAEKRKVGTKTAKVKANPTQLLLDDADTEQLKQWVLELLQKNKDLELAFNIKFTPKPTSYTTDEVVKITENAYKAVVKSKKNIDQTELKKLIELWGELHDPIIKTYLNDLYNYENFLHLVTIAVACKDYFFKLNLNSVKIHSYVNSLLLKTLEPLTNFVDDENFLKVSNYFLNAILEKNKIFGDYFFMYILKLIEISNQARKEILIDLLIKIYSSSKSYCSYDGEHPAKKLLAMVETAGLFNKYHEIFKPITYDNAFNIKLITALIENNNYAVATKYCYAQIDTNVRDEYNIAYLNFLKDIFLKTDNKIGLEDVSTKLLPLTFNFEDFLYKNSLFIDEKVQKDFRHKIFTKARGNGRNGNKYADKFCFQLLDYEKKYAKMIEIIDSYTPFSRIVEYFEPMFFAKKEDFIKAIFRKSDPWMYNSKEENEEETFVQLYEKIKKHYGDQYSALAFNKPLDYFTSDNKFILYVQNKILV